MFRLTVSVLLCGHNIYLINIFDQFLGGGTRVGRNSWRMGKIEKVQTLQILLLQFPRNSLQCGFTWHILELLLFISIELFLKCDDFEISDLKPN